MLGGVRGEDLLRVPLATGVRHAAARRGVPPDEPGEQPRVRLRGGGQPADQAGAGERGPGAHRRARPDHRGRGQGSTGGSAGLRLVRLVAERGGHRGGPSAGEEGEQADLVVVQVHMGGEGADKTHVRKGTEMFLGENRGDPMRFSHAVIDAGADLVVGHGPHVMRGMEFYQGRLIAYSMGNFFGYRSLSYSGVLGVSGILKATLRKDGSWVSGKLVATRVVAPGAPAMDQTNQAWSLIRSLCKADLPGTGAQIGAGGSISPG